MRQSRFLAILPQSAAPAIPDELPLAAPLTDEVVELDFPDLLGRRIFVSLDPAGREFDRGVAASEAEAQRVIARLYDGLLVAKRVTRPELLR